MVARIKCRLLLDANSIAAIRFYDRIDNRQDLLLRVFLLLLRRLAFN